MTEDIVRVLRVDSLIVSKIASMFVVFTIGVFIAEMLAVAFIDCCWCCCCHGRLPHLACGRTSPVVVILVSVVFKVLVALESQPLLVPIVFGMRARCECVSSPSAFLVPVW